MLLLRLQHEVFVAQSELAAPAPGPAPPHRILERHVRRLEEDTDRLTKTIEPIRSFVLPRGGRGATEIHVARTIARRAERELWALEEAEAVAPELLQWANRLSGLLFALALSVNRSAGFAEVPPDYSV